MNIAIFNSLPYHYEVFGFFIYYCFVNKYNLTIFTTLQDNYGYIDFYYLYFKEKNYYYKLRNYTELSKELLYFMDKVIVTTDYDPNVPKQLVSKNPEKFIFIGHCLTRMKDYFVPIFPFDGLAKFDKYVIPVFPIDLQKEKMKTNKYKKILFVGDGYDFKKIIHHNDLEYIWVHRQINKQKHIEEYIQSHTFRLMNLLKQCDFVLYPIGWNNTNTGHRDGRSMSGYCH